MHKVRQSNVPGSSTRFSQNIGRTIFAILLNSPLILATSATTTNGETTRLQGFVDQLGREQIFLDRLKAIDTTGVPGPGQDLRATIDEVFLSKIRSPPHLKNGRCRSASSAVSTRVFHDSLLPLPSTQQRTMTTTSFASIPSPSRSRKSSPIWMPVLRTNAFHRSFCLIRS